MLIYIFLLAGLASTLEFDPLLAEDLFQYTRMAYCKEEMLYSWNTEPAQRHPFMTELQVFTNNTHEAQGYCGYDSEHNRIVVAIRGSDNIANWKQNLNFFFEKYDGCDGCKVHRGFHNVYEDLVNNLLACSYWLTSSYPTAKLFVTGHSLGAAQATFAALEISKIVKPVDYFYNYGTPRVGNKAFADHIEKALSHTYLARIVHNKDAIQHLGTTSMGFHHYGYEIFMEGENPSEYKVCYRDDKKCSNKYFWPWQWNIKDHLYYYGQCAGCTQEGCANLI